ncbi:hypothetical protein HY949_01660 [Candidatus Gottesmanbacteria bacterium]|nr:hypothetical protein [Candidatus Gottesmanbacteria bacterium]
MNYKTLAAFLGIVALVFVVYFGTATRWTYRPPWTVDYINPMASALRAGRLDIPDPAMTYDLAQYHGKWYMTWGPLAAILHVPLQLMAGGRYVPALYTSLLYGSLTVAVMWWMFERVRQDWFREAPSLWAVACAFLYAFGSMQYYLSTVGSIWQINQVVSTFFGVMGTALIFRKKRTVLHYTLSSIFYAIASLGRPIVGLLVVIPMVVWFWERSWRTFVAVMVPLSIVFTMHLVYNAARFDSPLETGHRYLTEAPELADKREQFGMLSPVFVPTNTWHMLLAPPKFSWAKGFNMDIDLMGNSIFWLSPMLLFALGTLPWIWSGKHKLHALIAAVWSGIVLTAMPSLLYYNTGWMQFGYRYALDFSFLLVFLIYLRFQGRFRLWMLPIAIYTVWVNYTGIRLLQ